MKDRHDHRWGPAAAVLLLLIIPLLYPLSLGPAILIFDSMGQPDWLEPKLEIIYSPLADLPEPLHSALERYVELWDG